MNGIESGAPRFFNPVLIRAAFTPQQQSVLDEVNQRIAAQQSLDALLDFLFDATRAISPCDRIGLAFLDEDNRVVAHCVRAAYEPLLLGAGYAEDVQLGSLRRVVEQGWPRIIDDLEAYLAANPASQSTRLLVREGVRSNLTCPLSVEGRPVGILFRSCRRPNAYDEQQVAFQLAIDERLSQAVEAQRRIFLLEAANRAYLEMLAFVSHEVRNPLATIVTNARLLEEGIAAAPGEVAPAARRIVSSGEHLLGMVREYLDLSRLEGRELALNPVQNVDLVAQVLQPAIELVRSGMERRGMHLEREELREPLRAELDPDLMQIVLRNLLSNAIKYGHENGRIRVRYERPAGRLRVAVWNEGPGFPEEEHTRLFRKFTRLRTGVTRRQKGSGVGLYIVWRIVQLHHGRVWANSQPGAWAEFGFEIPQPLAPPASRDASPNRADES